MSTVFEPLLVLPVAPLVAVLLLLLLLPQAASVTAELMTTHPVINFPGNPIFLLCSARTLGRAL
jgi:hypothetical protein